MPSTIQGVGTKFYGAADKRQDGSYVTTKFFVLLMIPIWPLASFRVRPGAMQVSLFSQSQSYEVLETLATNWGQAVRVYAIAVAVLAALIAVLHFYA